MGKTGDLETWRHKTVVVTKEFPLPSRRAAEAVILLKQDPNVSAVLLLTALFGLAPVVSARASAATTRTPHDKRDDSRIQSALVEIVLRDGFAC